MTPPVLDARQLNRATLARQGLLEPIRDRSVARVVGRLGSLQAQHPDWPPLALAARLAAGNAPDLDNARRRRTVVRASLMRLTVHVVAAADYWPMSALTTPFRLDQFRLLYKLDPVTSPLAMRLRAAQPAAVAAMRELPRSAAEIEAILREELGPRVAIPPHRSLWRHFSGSVGLVQVPYDGETYGRSRYVAAADWLGPPRDGATDETTAAAHVAERYLAAFGPASVEDFAAYVGRGKGLTRLRRGIEALGERLAHFRDEAGRALVDLADAPRPPGDTPAPPRLLARWDSLLLAFGTRHRARVLPEAHQSTVITKNADVLPTFLVDGFVAGSWLPRRAADGTPRVELRPFGRLRRADRDALEAEAERLLPTLRDGAFGRYPGTD
ncbi:MAG TPA: crosslink repair DNA glycosylase YcaQ family protein [Candidatus Limnocylindria bacterium]